MSGQQCEPLELDREDRMRIEEIKRELLLLHPITVQTSGDQPRLAQLCVETV